MLFLFIMQQTKIQFLQAELELVLSPDIILTKNAILQKIKSFFEEVQPKQQEILSMYSSRLPMEVLKISPKISRGENYKGLPWLVLDNPRHFEHKNIFAIRTMFWWGNFFSVTLHISGRYKNDLSEKLFNNIVSATDHDLMIYDGEKEWEHDLDPAFYKYVKDLNDTELKDAFRRNAFLKIAIQCKIDSLSVVEDELCRNYGLLIKCCC